MGGRFFVVGGWADPPCPAGALCMRPKEPALRDGATFDPISGQWKRIADAPVPLSASLNVVVADGRLFLLTAELGRPDSPSTFLSYDPGEDQWATLPFPDTDSDCLQVLGAGTKVVVIACSDERGATQDAVFDTATARWSRLPTDPLRPSYGRTAAWLGDRLLLTASDLVPNPGSKGPTLTRLAVLDESLTQWTLLPDSDIIGGHPQWVSNRIVFPMLGSEDGGKVGNWGRHYPYGAILDPATRVWTALPDPPAPGSGIQGSIGNVGDSTLVGGQLLNPQTEKWTRLPDAPWDDASAQTMVTSTDSIFVWGGAANGRNVADGYLLIL